MSRAPEVDFHPYDPGFAADPYPVYARLRAESPVFYSAETRLTLFARHDDVRTLVLDGRLGRSMDHVTPPEALAHRRREAGSERLPNYSRYVRVNLLETEGADHARVRRLVAAAFGPRRVRELRHSVCALVQHLLEERMQDRRMDFIADLAAPLPVHVIAELLGWPPHERHRLRPWSAQIVRLYDQLLAMTPGPVVALNRAVAVAEIDGPEAALAIVEALRGAEVEDYYLFHAISADLLRRAGRTADAAQAYEAAIERTANARERDFLQRSLEALTRS